MRNRNYVQGNDLEDQAGAAGCSRGAAAQPPGCAIPDASRVRSSLFPLAFAIVAVACDGDDSSDPDPDIDLGAVPPVMELTGTASVERDDGSSAACSIFLRIEMDEGEEVGGAWVHRGTAGGEAQRDVMNEDSTGLSFWPLLHSGATARATVDSIEIMADGHDTVSVRFYQGIMHFRGARTGPGEASGEWTCAPLDLDSDGWLDTSVVAPGTWTLVTSEE